MQINLKGTVFCLTGKLTTMKRSEAFAAIEDAGGIITKSVTSKTNYMIVGVRPSSKYIKAKSMGIPCLTEEDFKVLMKGEAVEVEEVGAAGSRGVNELLGEVRSVMQGEPTAEMWIKLVDLLDECTAEDVGVLTDYIDDYIGRWSKESMAGKASKISDISRDKNDPRHRTYQWYYKLTGQRGELRVAPERWLGEMQQGVESPKYKIVRAIDLLRSRMNSAAITKIIKHPALSKLEVLILPDWVSPSKTLVKAIATSKTLKRVGFGRVNKKAVEYISKETHTPPELEILDLSELRFHGAGIFPGDKVDMLRSAMFSGVTQCVIGYINDDQLQLLNEIGRHELMPECKAFHINGIDAKELVVVLNTLPTTRTLRLSSDRLSCYIPESKKDWLAMLAMEYAGHIELLDFSTLTYSKKSKGLERTKQFIEEALPEAKLLERVDTLILGDWKTPELTAKLAEAHPDLTVL